MNSKLFSDEEMKRVTLQPKKEEPKAIPVGQCKLAKEIVDFSALTEFEQKVLSLLAYLGKSYSNSGKMKIFANRRNMLMSEINDIGANICRKGYLTYPWGSKGNFNNYEIRPQYYFRLILFLLDRHPEWLQEFETISSQNDTQKRIFGIMRNLYEERIDLIELTKPFTYYESFGRDIHYYSELLRYPFFAPYTMLVEEQSVVNAISSCITEDYVYDNIQEQHLKAYNLVADYAKKRNSDTALSLLNLARVYRFMLTGKLLHEDLSGWTIEMFAAKAIQMLYRGDAETATKMLDQALTMHNSTSKEKNIILNPLLSFFQILYYYKQPQTAALKKKVLSIAKKKIVEDKPELQGACFAAHHLILNDRAEHRKEDMSALKATKLPLNLQFYQLFTGIYSDVGCMPVHTLRPSTCALLRYEQSSYRDVADAEELEKALGGKPLLQAVEYKAAWEVVFEELVSASPKKSMEENDESHPDRVAYVWDGYGWMPQRQKWLKAGRWGTPGQLGMRPFFKGEPDCMDENDRQIVNAVRRYSYYDMSELFTAERIFPFLVGTDRVYYHSSQSEPLEPVEIREEKPFITIERNKKGFVIGSNIGAVKNNTMVRRLDDTHYSVFSLNDFEYNAFGRLLSLGTVPLSAEEMLKKYLADLSKLIEIHSDLIDGGSSLEQVSASSQVVLRLHPDGEQFVLQALVQPLEGGNMECVPGRGDAVVYVAKNGKRYQVNRNLREEKTALNELEQYLSANQNITLDDNYASLTLEQLLPLLEFAATNTARFAVEWLQDYKINVRTYNEEQAGEIRLKSKENWLEIEGELRLSEQEVMSYAELLRLMSEQKVAGRFVRLENGDFLALSEHISKQLSRLEQMAQFDRKKAHIPVYQIGAIARILEQSGKDVVADKSLRELIRKVEEASATDFPLPKGLRTELRDYQQTGYQWMNRLAAWGANGCLADDMGLGKTIQAMAFMLRHAADGPSLVVAPASVVFNWEQELQRFAPALTPITLNDADDRAKTINDLQPYHILLTTYGLLVREQEALAQRQWNIICLDEAHTIKNRQTKMSQAAMALKADHRLMLTGTPLQNNLSELWNLFQFLNPGLLGSYEQFNKRFIAPIELQHNKQQQQVLHRLLQPFILRRTKAEVVDELPEKVEITRKITLSDAERMHYEALRLNAQREVEAAERVDVKLLSMLTRLRQAACAPELVNPDWTEGSQKIDELMSLLTQIVAGGNTVLVFSQFTSFLQLVEKRLNTLTSDSDKGGTSDSDSGGIKYFYLDGSTPLPKRKQMVEQFQRGERQVFLISLKAGGLGLNLTAANYVIHLDPWWNPAIEQQATDRAYRIGQHQNVTVYHLIAADTIEEKILRLHKTKRDLADALLQDGDTTHTLSLNDLKELVAIMGDK